MIKPIDWIDRAKSGKFISPFSYNYPNKVMELAITKCTGYVPGSYKTTTKK